VVEEKVLAASHPTSIVTRSRAAANKKAEIASKEQKKKLSKLSKK